MSEGSDLDIFLVPSRRDITRGAGPPISGSGQWERNPASPKSLLNFVGDVAGQFQVLLLILAHGHMGRLVDQNIRRHQCGVGIKPPRGVLAVLARPCP